MTWRYLTSACAERARPTTLLIGLLVAVAVLVVTLQVTQNTKGVDEITPNRIESAELKACARLQRVRDATNHNGAVIYVVLSRAAQGRYRKLSRLPSYHPPVDCEAAVKRPDEYEPPLPVSFRELPKDRLKELLEP